MLSSKPFGGLRAANCAGNGNVKRKEVMTTRLEGWAVPVKKTGEHADHTYVRISEGKKWGCWGRHKGGQKICHGKGSSR